MVRIVVVLVVLVLVVSPGVFSVPLRHRVDHLGALTLLDVFVLRRLISSNRLVISHGLSFNRLVLSNRLLLSNGLFSNRLVFSHGLSFNRLVLSHGLSFDLRVFDRLVLDQRLIDGRATLRLQRRDRRGVFRFARLRDTFRSRLVRTRLIRSRLIRSRLIRSNVIRTGNHATGNNGSSRRSRGIRFSLLPLAALTARLRNRCNRSRRT